MTSRLSDRIKRLEATIAPQSRIFVFFATESEDLPPYAERRVTPSLRRLCLSLSCAMSSPSAASTSARLVKVRRRLTIASRRDRRDGTALAFLWAYVGR